MPRKIDINQPEIVAGLRERGYSVTITSNAGNGFVDIVVGGEVGGILYNWLVEIKNPEYSGKLTPREKQWHEAWKGQKAIVMTLQEALQVVSSIPRAESVDNKIY